MALRYQGAEQERDAILAAAMSAALRQFEARRSQNRIVSTVKLQVTRV